MSTTPAATIVTGVDFVSVPTSDLERAVVFYGETLGLHRSVYRPDANLAEFETGTVTLSVLDPAGMGIGQVQPNANHIALHVEDVPQARAELERRGVTFHGDVIDTGVCHMAIFADPDGNQLMLHRRYAPDEEAPLGRGGPEGLEPPGVAAPRPPTADADDIQALPAGPG